MKVSTRPSSGSPTGIFVSKAARRHPGASGLLALAFLLAAAPSARAQSAPEIFREIPVANLSAGTDTAELQGPNVVRSRFVEVDLGRILAQEPEQRSSRYSRSRGEARQRLMFNLFADATQEFELDHTEFSADGRSFAWYGRPTTAASGQALLVVQGGNVAGSVQTASGDFYRIRSVSEGVQVIRQVTYQGAPPTDDAVEVPESEVPVAAKAEQATANQSGSTTLDVMVVYTAAARQAAGGTSGIQSEIQLAIAELNQSFSNSGVAMQAQLVHTAEVSYNEQVDLSTSLSRLRSTNDGYMDNVHALRDQYGADVVALLINGPGSNGGTVGTGYIMQTQGSYFSAYAFSVTEVNFATGPAYALLHEIGHNLGSAHDRAHASSPGAYSYSYGYQQTQSPRFRTIMSYNCSGVNCPTANYWSNPNVSYQGYPTGVSSSSSSSADNSQSLNNTRATAAAWRDSVSGGGGGGGTGGGGGGGSSNVAPAASNVTPSSGSGSSQTFSATYSDSNGASDLRYTYVLIHSALTWTGSCGLRYDRPANKLQIIDDQGSAWLGGITPGSGSLSNSQCSVSGSGVSVNISSNSLSLTFPVVFQASFAGSRSVYLNVTDSANASSGWWQRGTWTVPSGGGSAPVAPSADSVTPSSGSGSPQTFTAAYSDGNGASDLRYMYVLIHDVLSWASSCGLRYDRTANRLEMINDQGSAWQTGLTPGSGSISNSQCSVAGSSVSTSVSGNTLRLTVPVSFSGSFAGSKKVYMNVVDMAGSAGGWYQRGTWSISGGSSGGGGGTGGSPSSPTVVSWSPSSGSGSAQTFTAVFSDANGFADLQYGYVLISQSLTWPSSCGLRYDRNNNKLQMINDQGSAWQNGLTPGSGSISNSACSVAGSGVAVNASGNTVSVSMTVTFKSNFAGAKSAWLNAVDQGGGSAGWQYGGSWTVPSGGGSGPVAPQSVSVSPSSGSGTSQTFTATYSDGNGTSDLVYTYWLFNSALTWPGSCGLRYDRAANVLQIINDQGSGWQGGITPGSGILSNSYCTVSGSGMAVNTSGNNLSISFPVTFKAGFQGAKSAFLNAMDKSSALSGWQLRGTWTVP